MADGNVLSVLLGSAGSTATKYGNEVKSDKQTEKANALQAYMTMLQTQEHQMAQEQHRMAMLRGAANLKQADLDIKLGNMKLNALANPEGELQKKINLENIGKINQLRQINPNVFADNDPLGILNMGGITDASQATGLDALALGELGKLKIPEGMSYDAGVFGNIQNPKFKPQAESTKVDNTTQGVEYWNKEYQKYLAKYEEDARNWNIVEHGGKGVPPKMSMREFLDTRGDIVPHRVKVKYMTDEELLSILGRNHGKRISR